MDRNSIIQNWVDKDDWECPTCNYCGSEPNTHLEIFQNVQNTRSTLVECPNCKLRFYSPRYKFSSRIKNHAYGISEASKKEAELYYENTAFFVAENKELQRQKIHSYYSAMIKRIEKLNGLPTSMFEVGGASGFFLTVARDLGVKSFAGVEVNKWNVQIAKEKFGFQDMFHSEFNKYDHDGTLYDCGVMLDYIEHSHTPYSDLIKIAGMIRSGGSFLLKTFLEELDINRTMESPLGHTYHFFGHVLKNMIEDAGFKILEWRLEGIMVIVIAKKV